MRSAFALRIISGKNILFVNRENLRIFPIYFFTGGVVAANSICSAAFCESAALRVVSSPFFMGKSATVDRQFSFTTPSVKMAKAQRKPFQIVHSAKKGCCTHGAAAFFCLRM